MSPYLILCLVSGVIFLSMFHFVYQYKKNITEIKQLSLSERVMDSISTSVRSKISMIAVESLRISEFTEYREYEKYGNQRFAFLYSIVSAKMSDITSHFGEISRVSLYNKGELEIDSFSREYIKEKYKRLDSFSYIENQSVINFNVLKGVSTEKIILMAKIYLSNESLTPINTGAYFQVYRELDIDGYYSSIKHSSASLIVLSDQYEIEKEIGAAENKIINEAIEILKGEENLFRLNRAEREGIDSNKELINTLKNNHMVICSIEISPKVKLLYVEEYKGHSAKNMMALNVAFFCLLVVLIFLGLFYVIKKIYIDKNIDLLNICIKQITQLHSDQFSDFNSPNIVMPVSTKKHISLIKNIQALESNVKRKSMYLHNLERRDSSTNLPNDKELKSNIETHDRNKDENIYLALFYIQPSPGMSKAVMTLMSQTNSVYSQISNEMSDLVFDYNLLELGSATIYKTSSETFSVLMETEHPEHFHLLIKTIVNTISQDRYENNFHFRTSCFCAWSKLDFKSEIKQTYYSKLNRTIEFSVKNNRKIQEFDYIVSQSIARENDLKFEILDSFKNDEFSLLYQPIFSAKKSIMTGVRVYPIWNHSIYGQVSPDEFMPILEDLRMDQQVQNSFICESLREINEWSKSGYRKLQVFITVTQIQMSSSNFFNDLIQMAKQNSVVHKQINILVDPKIFESESDVINANIQHIVDSDFNLGLCNQNFSFNSPSLIGLLKYKINKVILSVENIKDIINCEENNSVITHTYKTYKDFGIDLSFSDIDDIDLARKITKCGAEDLSGKCLALPVESFKISRYFDYNIKNRLNL